MSGVRHDQTIPQRLDQTKLEGTDGRDGENVPLILRDDGPQCATSRRSGSYED